MQGDLASPVASPDPPSMVRSMPIGLVLTTVAAFSLLSAACASPAVEEFAGTALRNANEAPAFDFTLSDQFGRPAGLGDHEGDVVVLTFMYTNCQDVCPIVTNQLRDVYAQLSEQTDTDGVAVLVVSVDPDRDTVDEAWTYLDKWGLVDDWKFLVGGRDELEPIWNAYHLRPGHIHDDSTEPQSDAAQGLSVGGGSAIDALRRGPYLVVHSTPVYLIDRQGRQRVVFTTPLDTGDVAHDIRLLLAE